MSKVVTLKYDPMWRPLDWAKKHCRSYITNQVHKESNGKYDPILIDYFFSSEKDAFLFKMQWSQVVA